MVNQHQRLSLSNAVCSDGLAQGDLLQPTAGLGSLGRAGCADVGHDEAMLFTPLHPTFSHQAVQRLAQRRLTASVALAQSLDGQPAARGLRAVDHVGAQPVVQAVERVAVA